MAYLGRARKEELKLLAVELGHEITDEMKISDLCKLISKDKDYDEEFTKNQLDIIIEDRKLREKQEREQTEQEKQQREREFELEKIRLENEKHKIIPDSSEVKVSTHELIKIVSLKESTEVDEFLETHKQPIVKLVRLKENESNSLSDNKTSAISFAECDKINTEPIVKLEMIHFPRKIVFDEEILIQNETVPIRKKQFAPNLPQQNAYSSVRCRKKAKNKNSRKSYRSLRNKTVSSKISPAHNLSDESIEIFDEDSSDSVQFLENYYKRKKLKTTSEF